MISDRFATPATFLLPGFGQGLRRSLQGPLTAIALGALGIAGLLLLWEGVAAGVAPDLPGPSATLRVFYDLVSNPFYDAGPNDKGIGLQLFASMKRVFAGFLVATVISVPVGVLIGISPALRRIFDPVIQLLRPVSPLAWFPIGLVVFQSAPQAAIFIVCVTSLWPTMINTAFGAGSVPNAYKNVARVFQFSRSQYFFRIVLPYSLPHVLTGMRLSMGTAWMVIVAGEMLSGGTGIGFFVWDSWNALSIERVISAIILIGAVGLVLDRAFLSLISRTAYQEVA